MTQRADQPNHASILLAVRRMTPADAEAYLTGLGVTDASQRAEMLQHAGKDQQQRPPELKVRITDPRRAHLSATLWTLGTTYRRIGSLLRVSHTTAYADVMQYMDQDEAPRLAVRLPYATAEWYKNKYIEHQTFLFTLDPLAAAKWLRRQRSAAHTDDQD